MSEPDDPLLVKARQLLFDGRVGEFNRLREKYPNLRLVLRGENLAGLDLAGIDLHGALLERVCLTDSVLTEACFDGATLLGCQARQGSFRGATFVGARFDSYKPLPGADTGDVRERTVFADADLVQADLSRARLTGVDLSGANLSDARLAGAALETVELQGAILRNTEAPYLRLRGNTGYLAKTWGTAESPGPKAGEGPILENCNVFRVQLVNSTDASTVIRPDWRPDGTRNEDPRQNETARRAKTRNDDTEEEETTMGNEGNHPPGRFEAIKNKATDVGHRVIETAKIEIPEAAIRAGATMFVRTTRLAIIEAYANFQKMSAKEKEHLLALADTDVGDMVVRFVLSGAIGLVPVPDGFKPYATSLEKELRVSAMASGGVALAQYVANTIGGPLVAAIEVMKSYTPDPSAQQQMGLLASPAPAFDPLRGHDAAQGVPAQPRTEG